MVGFDEDTSDEYITEEKIRASKNLLNINVKRYKEPESKTPKSVLAEILRLPPDVKLADGSEARWVSKGTYGNDKVFSVITVLPKINKFSVPPNKNKFYRNKSAALNLFDDDNDRLLTLIAYLESKQNGNVYHAKEYGDNNKNEIVYYAYAYLMKDVGGILLQGLYKMDKTNGESKLKELTKDDVPKITGLINYLIGIASDFKRNIIYISSALEEIKDKETSSIIREIFELSVKDSNVKII